MEVIIQYPPKVEQWQHEPDEKFLGHSSESMIHILGITPPDASNRDYVYFNVWTAMETENSQNGIVFSGKTYTCFKVRHKNHVPSVEFFFDLVQKADFEFAKIFYSRTQGTNLLGHKIPKPRLENLRADIQKCIDIWDRTIRNISLS